SALGTGTLLSFGTGDSTIVFAASSDLRNGTITLNGATATFVVAGASFGNAANVVGSGRIIKAGNGALAIFGSNSFVGTTVLNTGTIVITSINNRFSATNSLEMNGNGTLQISPSSFFTVTGNADILVNGDNHIAMASNTTVTFAAGSVFHGTGTLTKNA